MELNKLSYTKGSRNHKSKTYGRGFGSGIGKTSGKGTKGQKSRKSGGTRLGFEGGQTPIYRRLPKIGFSNVNFANQYNVVTIEQLATIKGEAVITPELLVKIRMIKKNHLPLKIIGSAKKMEKVLNVKAHKITAGAIKSIEKAHGKYEIITILTATKDQKKNNKMFVKISQPAKKTVAKTKIVSKPVDEIKKVDSKKKTVVPTKVVKEVKSVAFVKKTVSKSK